MALSYKFNLLNRVTLLLPTTNTITKQNENFESGKKHSNNLFRVDPTNNI